MTTFRAYSQSKLANILFTYELVRRLESGVVANCLHPGFVRTNLGRDNGPIYLCFYKLVGIFAAAPEKGAETVVYLASSPEVSGVTGKFFTKKKEVRSSEKSYDERTAKQLWKTSEVLTGISFL